MQRHNIAIFILAIIIVGLVGAVVFLVSTTQKEDAVEAPQVDQPATTTTATTTSLLLAATGMRKGHVSVPEYIKPDTLQVVSLGTVSKIDAAGDINVLAYKGGVTAVTAMMPDKDFGLMQIVVGDEAPDLTLETTAQGMVFMAPQLISSDPDLSRSILEVIRSDTSVAALAKDLDRVLRANGDPLKDAAFRTLYGKAIESVLNTLNK